MKNNLKKRLLAICLVIFMLLPLAVSCGNAKDDEKKDDQAQTTEEQSVTQETTEPRILPDLPDMQFDNHTFRILTFGVTGADQWENKDITAVEEIGETINDAVYKRNLAVEEKYKVKIEEVHSYDFGNLLSKSIKGGTNEYDLISPRLIDSANFILSGYFYNLLKAEYLDLEKPWYNQQGIKEMTLDGRLYIVMSDALLSDNDAASVTIFNKKLIEDYALEDPYKLVREGKWTVDKLYDMAKAIAKDANNDGKMDSNDVFGYLSMNDSMVSFLHSGGGRLAGKDENDLPIQTFDTPKTYEIMDKAFKLLYDDFVTGNTQKPSPKIIFEDLFTNNKSGFGWTRMYMIPKFRAMETDFGILPIPKIFDDQDKYYNTVNVHHACSLAIPITMDNIDRSSVIMEAMSAESKYTLVPAYYDIVLKTKLSRDNESAEMLDLIFSNTVIDIGDIYSFAEFGIKFYELALTNDKNLKSFYDKYSAKVETAMNKMIEKINTLD